MYIILISNNNPFDGREKLHTIYYCDTDYDIYIFFHIIEYNTNNNKKGRSCR